ncbi:zinc-dependent alcohol dehydrogenase [Propionicimonas sp.]|uniref:zinc-dependent alcohol dehydrogenase n=1 Tax=Propionicimonas sp. TaxID=1955623 RepID=UPI0039E3A8B2
MRSAVLYGTGDLRVEERAVPHAGPGQLVVRMLYAGLCGTDVEAYQHPILPPDMVLGHENVGEIVEVGDGVRGPWQVGMRIICGPPDACADGCPACRVGRTNVCSSAFPHTNGIGGPDGGMAEYMLVADADHTMLVAVPDDVASRDAVLYDPVCVALHGVRRSSFRVGDDVVVSGAGPVALGAIQFLKAGGARRLVVLGTNSAKFPLLERYGADVCINAKDSTDLGADIREALGRPEGADVTFECAGNATSLRNCVFSAAKNGGQVVLLGTIATPMDLVQAQFGPREIDLIGSFVYTRDEIGIFLDMLRAGKIAFPDLVGDVIGLDEVVARGLCRPDRGSALKILVDPSLR